MAEQKNETDWLTDVEQAADRADYTGALNLLESARPSAGKTPEFLYWSGYCQLHLGRYDLARESLVAARKADTGSNNRFRITVALANLLLRTGKYRDASALLEDLLGDGNHPDADSVVLNYSLGQAYFYLGHFGQALPAFNRALDIYEKLGNQRGTVNTIQSIAASHQLMHEPQAAIEAYLKAYRIADETGDRLSLGLIYLNLGSLYQDRALYSNARTHYELALGIMKELGRANYQAALLSNLGNLHVIIRQFARAEAYFHEAAALVQTPELNLYRAHLHLYQSELYRESGSLEKARQGLAQAEEIFQGFKNTNDFTLLFAGRTQLALKAGDLPAARDEFARFKSIAESLKTPAAQHQMALLEAKLELASGTGGKASKRLLNLLSQASTFYRKAGYLALLWDAETAAGRIALERGDIALAREKLMRAYDVHEEIRGNLKAEEREAYERRPEFEEFEKDCRRLSLDKSSFVLLKILAFNKRLNAGLDDTDTAGFLDSILEEAMNLSQSDEGYLYIGDNIRAAMSSEKGRLRPDSARIPNPERVWPLLEKVKATGEAELSVESVLPGDLSDSIRELEVISMMVVPIRALGRVMGLVYLHKRHSRGAFSAENLFLIEAFCDQAGLALSNSDRIRRVREHEAQLSTELSYLKNQVDSEFAVVESASPRFRDVMRMVKAASHGTGTVLLRGETGSGKEVLAREIHRLSGRAQGPFVRINVPAIPADLLESELFGYETGAFTGAEREKKGLLEIASGGSVLLDEIGDLPLPGQVKLLRALETRVITRLGGTREIPVDIRVIAATNRDLEHLMETGGFREDLYYRLNVFSIAIPPLRERREDILPLAEHFLQQLAASLGRHVTGFSENARAQLVNYPWPGNIRELKNVIHRALLLEEGPVLELAGFALDAAGAHQPEAAAQYHSRVEQTRMESVKEALAITGGNRKAAAKLLGISRSRLYEILKSAGSEAELPS